MDIVEEIRQNRESGSRRLVGEYKAGLMSLARQFCTDESDAEELVNATFAKVVENIDDYFEKSAFFAWMCSILTNLFNQSVRRKSRKMEVFSGVTPDAVDESAQDEIFRNLDHSLLRDAIKTLPDDQRELLLLHYFMDMPVAKIAKFLSIPNGTVFSRMHYARKALAAKLGVAVGEAARKPGGRIVLLALALCGMTALGAAIRWAALAAAGVGPGGSDAAGALPAAAVPATNVHALDFDETQGEQDMHTGTTRTAAMLAATMAAAANATTLIWTGGANNNLWCDADNWDSGGAAINFAAANDYVINDLPSGTTLTVSSTAIFRTLTMTAPSAANATWTITGTASMGCSGFDRAITVPTGCTLNLDVSAPNPWNGDNTYTLLGGGTLRHTKSWTTWGGTYLVKDASTLVFGAGSGGFEFSSFEMCDTATLRLETNTWIVRAYRSSGTPAIDLNGYTLTFNFGLAGDCAWTGGLVGAGVGMLTLAGPAVWTVNTSPSSGGVYNLVNGWLEMGSPDASLPADAVLSARGSGRLVLKSDQTLSTIYGPAATGGVDIPAGATLTVAGSNGVVSASTFDGRLSGAGGLTKGGAGYTLTLTGANTYAGPTRVAAGTLELRRDLARDGDIAYHFTFDGDGYLKDSVSGEPLQPSNAPERSLGDGVFGDCVALDAAKSQRLDLWPAALDNRIYTVSMWIRPTAAGGGTLFRWGDGWNGAENNNNLAHVRVDSGTALGGFGGVDATAPEGVTLTDGRWHHVVYTQEPYRKSLWIDGALCGTYDSPKECATYRNNIQFGAVDGWGCYSGSLDEIILANGVWPEERIRRETARCRAANALPDAAARLPRPVAKWTFNEDFVDSASGIELVSRGPGTPSLQTGGGAYGGFVRLESSAALGLAAGVDFPSCMPIGRAPFTVSVRYRHDSAEWRQTFGWGNTSVGAGFFAVGIGEAIRRNTLNWAHTGDGANVALYDAVARGDTVGTQAWNHIVATYDGSTLRAYRDGVLAASAPWTQLDLQPQDLFFGYRPNRNSYCVCDIDDVRVWDSALTDAQVHTLAQSLETDEAGSPLPAASAVTVDAGAVLKVSGYGHEAGTLGGGGTVRIDSYSALRVNGPSPFAGALEGCGSLVMAAGGDLSATAAGGFTGEVRAEGGSTVLNGSFSGGRATVASGARLSGGAQRTLLDEGYAAVTDGGGSSLPAVSGTGTVVIPATGRVAFTSHPTSGDYVLVDAGALETPADYSGWTATGTPYRVRFLAVGGRFIARLNGGTVIMLR